MMYAAYDQIRDRTHRILAAEKAKTARKGDVNEDGTPLAYSERVKVRLEELLREIDKGKFVWKPSNDGHATAFLKASGVPLWQTTKKGKTASGAAVLEAFANHAVVDELPRMRGNEALYDMNVRMFQWVQASDGNWKPPFVQDDGRVHPIWSPTQISGRYGSVNPASSNWTMGNETHADPKKRLPNIRRQLVAPPGRAIVAFDMEQLEARLIAVQSGDPFLCQIFADGLDIHHEFGVLVFPEMAAIKAADPKGFKGNEQYNMYRDLTKRFEYGAIYGGSDATVHKAVSADAPHITLKMTSQAIIKMKSRISHVFAWQQRLLAKTSQPPYTLWSYLLGRRRVFPMGKPPATDVANNPNQFAGADIMDIGYSRLVPRLEKYKGTAFLILNQHDADYFECDEADVLSLARDIQESFTQEVEAVNGQKILFPCDLKAGYSYAVEPSDKQKEKHPYLVWPVGRPGLKKVKV
jgi:DNA polymerase I-like protein with 3'-5' exonuclease and polymerase domains